MPKSFKRWKIVGSSHGNHQETCIGLHSPANYTDDVTNSPNDRNGVRSCNSEISSGRRELDIAHITEMGIQKNKTLTSKYFIEVIADLSLQT